MWFKCKNCDGFLNEKIFHVNTLSTKTHQSTCLLDLLLKLLETYLITTQLFQPSKFSYQVP